MLFGERDGRIGVRRCIREVDMLLELGGWSSCPFIRGEGDEEVFDAVPVDIGVLVGKIMGSLRVGLAVRVGGVIECDGRNALGNGAADSRFAGGPGNTDTEGSKSTLLRRDCSGFTSAMCIETSGNSGGTVRTSFLAAT